MQYYMQNQENINSDIPLEHEPENKKNSVTDDESDDDTYINITEMLDIQIKNIYQIQINNEIVVIKHIGRGSHVPDIIIKENFGKKKNLNLYNCVYANQEIDFFKTKVDEEKFFPIIKLVEKLEPENKIYSLSIKLKCLFNYNEPLTDFNLYLTYSTNSGHIYHIELDKNINSTNIIEKILEKLIELGINIL